MWLWLSSLSSRPYPKLALVCEKAVQLNPSFETLPQLSYSLFSSPRSSPNITQRPKQKFQKKMISNLSTYAEKPEGLLMGGGQRCIISNVGLAECLNTTPSQTKRTHFA